MTTSHHPDSRIIHARHFLSTHFGQTLGIRFYADTYPIHPAEVFDDLMTLAPISVSADLASRTIYGRTLIDEKIADDKAAFGFVVKLRNDIESVDLFLLVAAAEEFFGVSADMYSPLESVDLDLSDVFERMQSTVVAEGKP